MGGTMIGIGRSKADERLLTKTLQGPHNLRIRVRLLDLDHNYKEDFSHAFLDGAVTVDATQAVTRALDLVLFDPQKKIQLDPTSASRTSIYVADMISIIYVVSDPYRQNVFEIPVFCGPIDDVDRDEFNINIKCLGKESLSLSNAWRGRTFRKGQTRLFVIATILNMVGEKKRSLLNPKQRLPNDVKLNGKTAYWTLAKRIAAGMGKQLFYDGRGVVRMRAFPKKTSYWFTVDNMRTKPKVNYDLTQTINAVRVIGGKPKKSKRKIRYTAVAPRAHPLSPWRLGRGGQPRYLWMEITDDSIKSKAEARALAKSQLNRGLTVGVDVMFDGLVEPRLQELDIASVQYPGYTTRFAMNKFTIPLLAGEPSSYGYLKRSRPRGGAKGVRRRTVRRG